MSWLFASIVALAEPSDTEPEAGTAAAEAAPEAPAGPTDVTVGVHINDIMAIDLVTHSYTIDGYVWFRWKGDKDPASSMEFVNPFETWGHIEEPNYEEPEELPSGERYQVLRFQGGFSKGSFGNNMHYSDLGLKA